ncbi:hypothetical protein [Paenibacillus macerans]|uniref:hypothetical protein n=1 Tax=Paenibacillus macerans TaxID=44252 RepID=UPI003D32243E
MESKPKAKPAVNSAPQQAEAVFPGYPVAELMAEAETLLGVKPEVFAGATAGLDQKLMQVDEAKRLVKQFLGKRVL